MPKITDLNAAVSASDVDLLAIVQGGETKKVTAAILAALKAIGEGQAWTDVSGTRAASTIYTNSTGKPILIHVNALPSAPNTSFGIYVDGILSQSTAATTTNYRIAHTAIVPNGSTYKIEPFVGTLSGINWKELR